MRGRAPLSGWRAATPMVLRDPSSDPFGATFSPKREKGACHAAFLLRHVSAEHVVDDAFEFVERRAGLGHRAEAFVALHLRVAAGPEAFRLRVQPDHRPRPL